MSRDFGFGPAVLDGKLRYVSVSAIEKFDAASYGGCARRWWYRYVAHKPEKQLKAQKLGTQVHAQIEHYLRTGQDVLGELARAGKRFLPLPMTEAPGLDVEVEVGGMREHMPGGFHGPVDSELDCAGIPVVVFIDALNARGSTQNDDGELVIEPDVVEAIDWKSTKQIDNEVNPETGIVVSQGYGKSAEELANTHQMVGYGELLCRRFTNLRAARLSHGIFQTKGARAAVKRSSLVTVAQIRERWRRSEAVVEKMKVVAAETDIEKVPANLKSCSAYGGCPHRSICPRDPIAVFKEMFGRKSMSLLDRVKAKATPAAPLAPAPVIAAEVAALVAEENAMMSIAPPDVPEPSAVAQLPDAVTEIPGACQADKQVKLDADALVAKKYACPCGTLVKVKPTKLGDGAYYALVPKHEQPAATTTMTAAPIETPKVATLVYTGAKSPEAKAELRAEDEPVKDDKPETGITLYLDCAEDGVSTQRLETYAQAKADELAALEGAGDVRCAPEKSGLAFGKWKGALAAYARLRPPAPGAYAVSMANEIAAVVAEALAPTAVRVVRGRS